MGDIPTSAIGMKSQIGVETGWGTEVDATIALGSVEITPGIKTDVEKFTPKGALAPTVMVYGMEWGELSFEGKACYEEINNFVKTISGTLLTAVPSVTAEAGGRTYPGAVVTGWTLKGNTKSIDISGAMLSKSHNDSGYKEGLSIPTVLTPLQNDQVTITIDSVAVTNAFDWEVSATDMWALAQFVGSAMPGGINQSPINASFVLNMEADSTNLARIADREIKPVTIAFTTGGATPKTFNLAFNVQRETVEKFSANGQVYGYGLRYAIKNGTNIITVS